LGHVPDALFDALGILCDVETHHGAATAGWIEDAAEHADGRRLAGPIRT
jgi:hypothetical protein